MKPLRSYLFLFGGLWLAGGLFSPQCSAATAEAATATAVTSSVPTATDIVLAKAPVLSRKVFNLGDHSVAFIRIRKPNLPLLPVKPAQVLTAAEQAAIARRAPKAFTSLSLFATSYPGIGTELSVRLDDLEVHAFSNVDFRQFSPISDIETGTTVYSWMGMIGEGSPDDLPADLRAALKEELSATGPDFVVADSGTDDDRVIAVLRFLDAVHDYYAAHKPALVAAYAKRVATAAARERQLLANPPKPPDITVHFWQEASPVNSR